MTVPAAGACSVTAVLLVSQDGPKTISLPAGGFTSTNAASNTSPASITLNAVADIPTLSAIALALMAIVLSVAGAIVVRD